MLRDGTLSYADADCVPLHYDTDLGHSISYSENNCGYYFKESDNILKFVKYPR